MLIYGRHHWLIFVFLTGRSWRTHQTKLQTSITMADASVLRDFTQPDELSDLTIIISGTPLHVHKQYLAEWSPVWRRMFLEGYTDHDQLREVHLADKTIEEFTELLHCIYSTQKPISGICFYDPRLSVCQSVCRSPLTFNLVQLITQEHFTPEA